jgi:hypothetical protein
MLNAQFPKEARGGERRGSDGVEYREYSYCNRYTYCNMYTYCNNYTARLRRVGRVHGMEEGLEDE